jgi:hypothetical protein
LIVNNCRGPLGEICWLVKNKPAAKRRKKAWKT